MENNIKIEPLTTEQKETLVSDLFSMMSNENTQFISKEKYDELEQYNMKLKDKVEQIQDKLDNTKLELQEANESITWWANRFNSAEAEVRTFKSDFEAQAKLTTEYKNRIDRAIEYIEEYKEEGMGEEWFRSSTPVSYLLNILKGSDNDE